MNFCILNKVIDVEMVSNTPTNTGLNVQVKLVGLPINSGTREAVSIH